MHRLPRIGWIPVVALIPLLAGCGGSEADPASETTAEVPRNVRVLTIRSHDLNEYLTISGPAAPLRGTDLSAEESGQVAEIPNDKGARVDGGDVLILLDRRLLKAQKESAEAARDLSAYNEDRTRQLFDAQSVSRIELLEAETRLQEARAAARIAELRYDRSAIQAPFAGVVTKRYVELGQLVVPGMPVARIVDPYVLTLKGAVTEREVHSVSEGESAAVAFDGVVGAAQGHVHWVGFEADLLSGKFPVEIRIENPELRLRPGTIGRAQVLKAVHQGVITIPRDAVIERSSGPIAFVVEGSQARERRLRLGSDQGLMVVVEDGLQAGDRLIVRGQRDVHDGSAVLVQEETTTPDGSTPSDPPVVTQARTVSDAWQ